MVMTITCPNCGQRLKAKPEALGNRVRCKNCRHGFVLEVAVRAVERSGQQVQPPPLSPIADSPVSFDQTMPARPLPPSMPTAHARAVPASDARFAAARPALLVHAPGFVSRHAYLLLAAIFVVVLGASGTIAYLLFGTKKDAAHGQYGCIEIGSKGIKMVAADVFHDGNFLNYESLGGDDRSVDLGSSVAQGGRSFDEKSLAAAMTVVKDFFETMRDKHGVPPERIHVICSSGVFSQKGDVQAGDSRERELTVAVKQAINKTIDYISPGHKAKCDFLACSPRGAAEQDCLLIHIGDGDTKGGYFNGQVFESMSFAYGTSSYRALIDGEMKKQRVPPGEELDAFDKLARRLRDDKLTSKLQGEFGGKQGLKDRPKIYLFGGIVWAMTAYMRPDQLVRYRIQINANDIQRFREKIARKPIDEMENDSLENVDEDHKEDVRAVLKKIRKVFKHEEKNEKTGKKQDMRYALIAGTEILAALSLQYNFDGKSPEFYRDSHLACAIGYILDKVAVEK
jgi:hypothetical protein